MAWGGRGVGGPGVGCRQSWVYGVRVALGGVVGGLGVGVVGGPK